MAYIAYHFNWSKSEIMEMIHSERKKWITVISDMNKHINETNELHYKERFRDLMKRKDR